MRPRSALRDALEYMAVRLVLAALSYGPFTVSFALARGLFRILDLCIPRWRRVAERNLCLAGLDRSIADGVFRSLARSLCVFARLPALRKSNVGSWIRYEGFEHFQTALGKGRGVLFATAHLGNWELSAFAHALMTAPMHVMVRPLDNPFLDRLVTSRRTASGNRIITKTGAARAVLRALRRNDAAGILIDQNASLEDGVFVDFFGLKASASASVARIAALSGAAVIPGFALWSESEGRYILRFDAPLPMTGDIQADTQRLHAHLESVIRRYPDQWLWIHRRWKTRPPGEPPLY